MANKEVRASSVAVGDAIDMGGGAEVVIARIRVGFPDHDLLLTENGSALSVTDSQLINRVGTGRAVTPYEGPGWICGMPEQVSVFQLEPGDMMLGARLQTIRKVLRTDSNAVVVVLTEGKPRILDLKASVRLLARKIPVDPWIGVGELPGTVELIPAGSVRAGDTIVGASSLQEVVEVVRQVLGATALLLDDSTRCSMERDERLIRVVAREESAASASGNPDPRGRPVGECGKCGRTRLEGQNFCTGCGAKHSAISTTGFQY